MTDLEKRALDLYRAPFKFYRGYIHDVNGEMVADDDKPDPIQRVRGWGRIGYMESPEQLQDAVGHLIAKALTEFWEKHQ